MLLGEAGRGLSVNDVDLLRTIVTSGPVRASTLAEWNGVDKSTMAPQVRRLEERGLIVRRPDPTDRRAVLLTATARGSQLQERMDATGVEIIEDVLRDWPEDDRRALSDLFEEGTA